MYFLPKHKLNTLYYRIVPKLWKAIYFWWVSLSFGIFKHYKNIKYFILDYLRIHKYKNKIYYIITWIN